MAATLPLDSLTLGSGQPHIVVSIMGRTDEEILASARRVAVYPEITLAEWRADDYNAAPDAQKALQMLQKIKTTLPDKPLIFTFRTAQEGGKASLSAQQYIDLCQTIAASKLAALIDVEMFFDDAAAACVEKIHALGGLVLGSWHHFDAVPGAQEMKERFERMQNMGADVLKMAVMPHSEQETTDFIAAVKHFSQTATRPLCAIAMGDLGRISRTHGETFGSCMTFGALDTRSAPGQIPVKPLHEALCALHHSLATEC